MAAPVTVVGVARFGDGGRHALSSFRVPVEGAGGS